APSRFIPQPIGDRQFVPSIVPPCTTRYLRFPAVMCSTWLLATSPGLAFEAQGSSAASEPGDAKTAADKIAANMVVSRNTSNDSPRTTQRPLIEPPGCGQVLWGVGETARKEAVPRPACDWEEHRQSSWLYSRF